MNTAPLKADIERKQNQLEKLRQEFHDYYLQKQPISEPQQSPEILRTLGSQLHDFYTGVEEIFQLIQQRIDGDDITTTDEWHKVLLERMTEEIEGKRPAVISKEVYENLREYCGFRHVFRTAYGFELQWSKMEKLVTNYEETHDNVNHELEEFKSFLTSL